ncbi:MAG: DUF3332 domain-containing protein [Leptospirales bacterium]|nr:DUF3332 domain-containing protein [Leptospirales bacterium]
MKIRKVTAALLAAGISLSAGGACHGSFVLNRGWDRFVSGINNKWVKAIIFIISIPIYFIAFALDAIVFNLVEFWSGSNPIAGAGSDGQQSAVVIENQNERIEMVRSPDGERLDIQISREGQPVFAFVALRAAPGALFVEQGGRLEIANASIMREAGGALLQLNAGGEDLGQRRIDNSTLEALQNAQFRLEAGLR